MLHKFLQKIPVIFEANIIMIPNSDKDSTRKKNPTDQYYSNIKILGVPGWLGG